MSDYIQSMDSKTLKQRSEICVTYIKTASHNLVQSQGKYREYWAHSKVTWIESHLITVTEQQRRSPSLYKARMLVNINRDLARAHSVWQSAIRGIAA